VGQNIGIDPFAPEHMNNIPYNRPGGDGGLPPTSDFSSAPSMAASTPPGLQGPSPWGSKKPVVLLVEDDRTCARIGSKFLSQHDCGVEVAVRRINPLLCTADFWRLTSFSVMASKL
jgi:osomolarity two-component system, response regulator SKN7